MWVRAISCVRDCRGTGLRSTAAVCTSCLLCSGSIALLRSSTTLPETALHSSQYRRDDHLLRRSSWGNVCTVTTELASRVPDGIDLLLTQSLL